MGWIVKYMQVRQGNAVIIPRRPAQDWFGAGDALMAPLYFKRGLLLDEGDLLRVWTVYPVDAPTQNWNIQPKLTNIEFSIKASSRGQRGGWEFVIPAAIRDPGWLPGEGERIVREIDNGEINVWHPTAYNIQRLREELP